MQKSKQSKKLNIDKLRMILDNPHIKDSSIKNETYLNALQKRLTGYSKDKFEKKTESNTIVDNSLTPKVTIHRKMNSTFIPSILKILKPDDTRFIEQKNNLFEDEELFDVEKIDLDIPEFIEVKPTKEGESTYIETDSVETFDEFEDLPDWEVVDEFQEKDLKKVEEPDIKRTEDSGDIPEWESVSTIEADKKKKKSYSETDFEEAKTGEFEEIKEGDVKEFEEVEKFDELQPISFVDEEDVFKNIKSINQKVSKSLIENNITSIDILKEAKINDLTKIKGIRKGLAKKIKKEVDEKYFEVDELPDEETLVEPKITPEEKTKEIKHEQIKGYKHGEYILYEKEIKLRSDKKQTIHFFSKDIPDDGKPVDLPDDYEVKVNRKTGVPYIRRKK
jgi:hypothetical protein